jgi:hypothetical protein
MSMDQYSKAHVVSLLKSMGYPDLAEEASRDLPDPVEANQASKWMFDHGLSYDTIMSEMGGSP